MIKLSLIQLQAGADKAANLAQLESLIDKACSKKPDLIALPEVINYRGKISLEKDNAEKLETGNPSFDLISKLAKKYQVSIMAGSILEANPEDPDKPLNTSFYINKEGKLLARYSKIHLFDVDIGDKVIQESKTRAFGEAKLEVFTDELAGKTINMAMSICYDLRFPELYRQLIFKDKCPDIIFAPSAFSKPTGEAHWHTLVRARAIENTVFMIAPNQFGESESSFTCYGHSLVVDPWGTVIAEASGDNQEILFVELDLDLLSKTRAKLPLSNARLI